MKAVEPVLWRPHANPMLAGNLAPIDTEYDLEDLPAQGRVPPDLNGVFLRIGPNPEFAPFEPYHFFEGNGMLHAFYINQQKVSYKNRWVRIPRFNTEHRAQKPFFGVFGSAAQTDWLA